MSQQQAQGQLATSPVARIEVQPASRTITAGDSVRLMVRALDASGAPLPNAVLYVQLRGGEGEGALDPASGWLVASSIGKFPLALSATVPGSRPFVDTTSTEFDVVPGPAVRMELAPTSATIVDGQSLRVGALAYSKANDRTLDAVRWQSSRPKIVAVDGDGTITGLAPGRSTLTASVRGASASLDVRVVPASGIAKLAVRPAKPSVRQGDVVAFSAEGRDGAGHPVAGLRPTWSFAPGDGQLDADGRFVAYRPGIYTVTASLGRRSASTTVTVEERDVRRSVTVVGRLPVTAFATSEVWIHPNGKVAYLGTHMGGDRVYAIDISDPGKPVVVDSIMANTRLVNDMQTTADGNVMVFTREGASDRKNGIVIADTRDPLHPKEIAQFTDGVAAGVHSVYIYENPQVRPLRLHHQRRHRRHRHRQPDRPGASGPRRRVAHRPPRRRALRARPRHRRRPDVRELLERRAGHPRYRERQVGRAAGEAGARLPVQVQPRLALQGGGGRLAAGLHRAVRTPPGGSAAASTSSSPTRSIATARSRAPRTPRRAGCTAPCR